LDISSQGINTPYNPRNKAHGDLAVNGNNVYQKQPALPMQ